MKKVELDQLTCGGTWNLEVIDGVAAGTVLQG
jgi:hypothetical protein